MFLRVHRAAVGRGHSFRRAARLHAASLARYCLRESLATRDALLQERPRPPCFSRGHPTNTRLRIPTPYAVRKLRRTTRRTPHAYTRRLARQEVAPWGPSALPLPIS